MIYFIFSFEGSCVSAHPLVYLFLPNGLVEIEVSIYLNKYVSLLLVK